MKMIKKGDERIPNQKTKPIVNSKTLGPLGWPNWLAANEKNKIPPKNIINGTIVIRNGKKAFKI